ncbi:hypothetical protein [Sorangium sp. So ce1078]|uniref:hypothetical protein n=1 Tax=Sorangium sp. So ce1078 TaxID=3133329 RepID=UPI003F5E6C67
MASSLHGARFSLLLNQHDDLGFSFRHILWKIDLDASRLGNVDNERRLNTLQYR